MSKEYIVVHFKKQKTYSIINDENRKLVNSKKAHVKDEDGSWVIGDIVFRGTEKACVKYGKQYLEQDKIEYKPTDDESSEFESADCDKHLDKIANLDDPIVQQEISRVRQIRKQIDSRSPSMKRKCDSTDKENFSNQFERQSLAKKPNDSTTPNTPTTSKSNDSSLNSIDSNNDSLDFDSHYTTNEARDNEPITLDNDAPIEVDTVKLLQTIADEVFKLKDMIEQTNLELKNIQIRPKSSKSSEEEQKEVVYNGKNLIEIHASAQNKYVNATMKYLFSEDELKNGYIIEDKSTSKRSPLDLVRINLLKEAVFTKYRVSSVKREQVWSEVKKIANRLCTDTSNKATKNKSNND